MATPPDVRAQIDAEALRLAAPGAPTAETYLDIGRDHLAEMRNAQARSAFEAATRLDPKNLSARFALGRLLWAAGDARAAAESFRACVDGKGEGLFLEMEDPWLHLGYCHELLGEADEAARRYRESLGANPAGGDNAVSLGTLLMQRSRHAEAEEVFRAAAARIGPRRAEFEYYAKLAAERKPFASYRSPGTGVTMRIDRALDAIEGMQKDGGGGEGVNA